MFHVKHPLASLLGGYILKLRWSVAAFGENPAGFFIPQFSGFAEKFGHSCHGACGDCVEGLRTIFCPRSEDLGVSKFQGITHLPQPIRPKFTRFDQGNCEVAPQKGDDQTGQPCAGPYIAPAAATAGMMVQQLRRIRDMPHPYFFDRVGRDKVLPFILLPERFDIGGAIRQSRWAPAPPDI